jgi:hypothetical protein
LIAGKQRDFSMAQGQIKKILLLDVWQPIIHAPVFLRQARRLGDLSGNAT